MEGGPWLFRRAAVVIEEYDGFSSVQTYRLDKIPVWTRVQGVPDGLMKKRELAEKVARKVGDPIHVIVNEGRINPAPLSPPLSLSLSLVSSLPCLTPERSAR